jgi:hypothetical protein
MRQFIALAGLVVLAPMSWAQFAADRTQPSATTPFGGAAPVASPTAAAPFRGTAPAAPTTATSAPINNPAPPQPAQRVNPVPSTIDPNNQQQHPWAVKLEHGPWMICVRAYVGPNSRELAEKLVQEIRTTYKTAAYVFERNGAERKAELAQIQAIRDKEMEKAQPFLKVIEQEKKKDPGSFIEGSRPTIKVPMPYHQTPEQWAVLIGGFKTDVEARKALEIVRAFRNPADVTLMAEVTIVSAAAAGEKEGKPTQGYLNPYQGSIVVPNPMQASASRDEKGKLEPFVVKMNEEGTYNLLKARKPWTLIVRSFSVPMRFAGKEEKSESLLEKFMNAAGPKQRSLFDVTAAEAENFAAALSNPMMENGPFKAFVLHHRTGSIVTVGEFDAPDDPELLRVQKLLSGLTFKMKDKNKQPVIGKDGRPEEQRMFDSVSPFPVPKY